MKRYFIFIATLMFASHTQAQTLSGTMETWRDVTTMFDTTILESPKGWSNTDSIVFMAKFLYPGAQFKKQTFRDNDAHEGNYAVRLVTRNQSALGTLPGVLVNASPFVPMSSLIPLYLGGLPVTSRVSGVTAWVKYFPNGSDTAVAVVKALMSGAGYAGADSVIGENTVYIAGTHSAYTYIDVPATYFNDSDIPDRIQVFFRSSNKAPRDSSTLLVDDINLKETTAAISLNGTVCDVQCYPNPATNTIYFQLPSIKSYCLSIMNVAGALTTQKTISGATKVDVATWPEGVYFYIVSDGSNSIAQYGRFLIER